VSRIKSAAELAMEKTKNLQQKKEATSAQTEQYVQAARKIAQNLTEGKSEVEKVKEALKRYPEDVLPEVTRAMLQEFSRGINLDNTTTLLKAVALLKDDNATSQALKEVEALYQKYYQWREQKVKEIEEASLKKLLKKLKDEGISGKAIYRVSLKGDRRIEGIKEEIDQDYRQNLSGFLSYLTQES